MFSKTKIKELTMFKNDSFKIAYCDSDNLADILCQLTENRLFLYCEDFLLKKLSEPAVRNGFIFDNDLEEKINVDINYESFLTAASFENGFNLVSLDSEVRGFIYLYLCYAIKMDEYIISFSSDLDVDRFASIVKNRQCSYIENYDLLKSYSNEIRGVASYSYWHGIPDFDISQGVILYRNDTVLKFVKDVLSRKIENFLHEKSDWSSAIGVQSVCYPEAICENFN